jgi:hypothetical protein
MTTTTLYDVDFFAWTKEQAKLLRQEEYGRLDITNLVEEIEDMGKSQQRQLYSRLVVLMTHLLKWQFQPGKQSRSWQATIRVQRRRLQRLLDQNPSLRAQLDQTIVEAYADAIDEVWAETGLDVETFPSACPYTSAEILADTFFPSDNP